jgi:hypothetical protein
MNEWLFECGRQGKKERNHVVDIGIDTVDHVDAWDGHIIHAGRASAYLSVRRNYRDSISANQRPNRVRVATG